MRLGSGPGWKRLRRTVFERTPRLSRNRLSLGRIGRQTTCRYGIGCVPILLWLMEESPSSRGAQSGSRRQDKGETDKRPGEIGAVVLDAGDHFPRGRPVDGI